MTTSRREGPFALDVDFLDEAQFAEWDAFVDHAADGCLFHKASWARLVGEPDARRARVLVARRGSTIVGGCPTFERRRLGLTICSPPILAGYAGILADAAALDVPGTTLEARRSEIVRALEAGLRGRYDYARVTHETRLLDARPLIEGGWRVIPRFSLRIALAGADEMLESFEHNVRKHIRKANEAALVVRRVAAVEDILPTYAAAYERHGVPPPVPQPLLRETVRAVLDAGVGLAYVVEDAGGARHAFQVILVDGPRAYAWIAGADPLCLSGGGVSLLLWRVMSELAETRRELDFMGANTREIARFKVPFGGSLFTFWETIHATGGARALLSAGSLLQRVRRRGPAARAGQPT